MAESDIFRDLERALTWQTATMIDGRPLLLARDDMVLHDLSPYLAHPTQIARDVKVVGVEDFVRYASLFADLSTRVYADCDHFSVRAILDDHSKDGPRWCRHAVTMKSEYGLEYAAWKIMAGKTAPISQEVLARFLLDRRVDVVSMDGAELLTLVADFKASQSAVFRSARNLQNGDTQFEYSVDTKTGALRVPEEIKISVRVFAGQSDPVDVRVRLLYRVTDGKLGFTLEIPDAGIFERRVYAEEVLRPLVAGMPTDILMVKVAELP